MILCTQVPVRYVLWIFYLISPSGKLSKQKKQTRIVSAQRKCQIMQNTLKNSLFGIMIMPAILASSNPAGTLSITNPIQEVVQNQAHQKELAIEAQKIDTYFGDKGLPLAGHGAEMIEASEKYGLDWRLLPALAMRETGGGDKACPVTYKKTKDIRYTYNVFGWGSCGIKFDSYEDAFDTLAMNLSGNNPATAKYYKGKDLDGILKTYNPVHIVKNYSPQVQAIMVAIDNTVPETAELAMNTQ